MTALLWAANMGHLDVLQFLLSHEADVGCKDESGLTALLWAADRGHVACVDALVAAGADINAVDKVSIFFSRYLRFAFFCLVNIIPFHICKFTLF
jgi:ankyrin repeat protein